MPTQPFTGRLNQLPTEVVTGWDLSRSAIRTDAGLVVINWLEPGDGSMPDYHEHPFDQLTLIFAGRAEFQIEDTSYSLSVGDFLYVPASRPHRGIALGEEVVLNVDVFAPVREDYLHLVSAQPD